MERQELKLMVDILIGNTGDGIPGQRTALGSGKVLHRMEREGGKIRQCSDRLSLPRCIEGMGGICLIVVRFQRMLRTKLTITTVAATEAENV